MELQLTLVRQKYTPFGGAERFVSRALEALAAKGVDIRVVARSWSGESRFTLERCAPFHIGRLWRDASFGRAACRRLSRQTSGLVQSHERIPCCDIYRAGDGVHREWLRQRARLRGDWSDRLTRLSPYHRFLLRAEERLFASPRLKAVICNSRMVRAEIQEWFGLAEERLPVIHNGVDTGRYHPRLKEEYRVPLRRQWGIAEDAPLFLFVGSGFERKGLDAALRAMTCLDEPLSRLLVVGKDSRTRHYRNFSIRLGLEGRVIFAGPQKDVRPFYGAADAFLLPTLYDPFPNVVLEAMASGLPVITSYKSGSRDIINEGINGYCCDALNVDALAGRMTALLDPGTRDRLGREARKTVEPLTLDRMADEYLALYHRLLGLNDQTSL
ncbi:MAG: glycosyltransferase family 4 protein [Gammaproteobacteria bacterium]|nr:glycosyltransferase family 4 protein [Gammaproteobacteria bacterium]MBU1656265.1 glycosyltransferase family 4 protein [Gammaproteobacteria bacterium]MBU1959830.1 glycosyltransferase family 4 protein [Gammaproteobacteria bacterium]